MATDIQVHPSVTLDGYPSEPVGVHGPIELGRNDVTDEDQREEEGLVPLPPSSLSRSQTQHDPGLPLSLSSSTSRAPTPLIPYRSQQIQSTTFLIDPSIPSSSSSSIPTSIFSPSSSSYRSQPQLQGQKRYTLGQPLSTVPSRSRSRSGSRSGDLDGADLGVGVIRPRLARTPPIGSTVGTTENPFGRAGSKGESSVMASASDTVPGHSKGKSRDLGGGDVLDLGEDPSWEEEYRRRAERGVASLEMDPTARYHRHHPPREDPTSPTSRSLLSFFSSGHLPQQPTEPRTTTSGPASPSPINPSNMTTALRRDYIGNEEVDSAGFGQLAFGKSGSPQSDPDKLGLGLGLGPRNPPSSWPGLAIPKRSPSGSSILSMGEGRGVILTPTTQEWRELGMEQSGELGGQGGEGSGSNSGESGSEGDSRRGSRDESDDGAESHLNDKRSSWGTVKTIGEGARTPGMVLPRSNSFQHRRSRSATVLSVEHLHDMRSEDRWPGGDEDDDISGENGVGSDADLSHSRRGLHSPGSRGNGFGAMSRDGSRSAPPQMEEKDLFAALFALQQARAQEASGGENEGNGNKFDLNALGLSKTTFHAVETLLPPSLLSRSQSVRVSSEPEKRKEKERDRLFRMVGEDIEMHGIEPPTNSWGVKQVGSGWALDYIPPARETRSPSAEHDAKSVSNGRLTSNEKANSARRSGNLAAPVPVRLSSTSPISPSPLSHVAHMEEQASHASQSTSHPRSRKPTRQHPRSRRPSYNPAESEPLPPDSTAPMSPITSRRRQSQRLSMLAGRTPQPFAFPAALPPSGPTGQKKLTGLSAFSPFHSSPPKKGTIAPLESPQPMAIPPHLQHVGRSDSVISIAPSIAAPSPSGTPVGETAGGAGGHGIHDYSIVSEAGRGAYGMVKRARRLSPLTNEPFGEEVIIKYIIKSRILADCWKKHKLLGPIPIEIHVMDQLRNVTYTPPGGRLPWDPLRPKKDGSSSLKCPGEHTPTIGSPMYSPASSNTTPLAEKTALEWSARMSFDAVCDRGHPNVCKMLDFFEDKEFYYLVMPRFGVGLDLFDRIESAPDGLDPFDIRSLLGQLSDALKFLHANGIVHRDIKDENVILDGDGHCQLIDFGSAAHWRPYRKWDTFSGTLDYASPEILRGEMYSGKEQDVWALGIVAFVLIAGETPFLSADEAQNGFEEGTKARSGLAERCCGPHGEDGLEADGGGQMKDAMDFVERCCEPEPEHRPSADDLVRHRFIAGKEGWIGHRGWIGDEAEILKSPTM